MTFNKKNLAYLSFCFAAFFAAVSIFVFVANSGIAQDDLENIQFPVAELGNCATRTECEAYCDIDENVLACVSFAEANGLMSPEEAAIARKVGELGVIGGPGGCSSHTECEAYCNNVNNMQECIIFARDNGMMPPDEIAEAEKVLAALQKGAVLPGGCANKASCEAYCDNPDHVVECVAFAEAAGFMSADEAVMVRKTGGRGPGGCRGKNECDGYCDNPDHMQACIEFAVEYDLMPSGEREEAMKALTALRKGVKMPNCRGDRECDIYCSQPEHMLECIAFAEAAGFMSAEDAARSRRMAELGITGGPGGCNSEKECEAFCQNPANMEICIDFSVIVGDMTPEEAIEAKKGLKYVGKCDSPEECMIYCQNNPTDEICEGDRHEEGEYHEEEEQPGAQLPPGSSLIDALEFLISNSRAVFFEAKILK